ncbi:hypothetical protein HC251_24130 [Iamia sp. SCSIO 61187]|uniref:DUF6361 family protein n=1 Tax=Iamia sp. SCSIO 61187 TaxID=2722752 RepID=UPI001C62BF8B|nr:DUF6361 family protein [Iamia sp. SCSIO 61187]QYG95211.1 hypothetical protein HC251_24130 [Iamia sp. SCSIO 61187]
MAVATFTWLDHNDEDAQRVREALAAFDSPGMIDPLGFGPVRDAFSELLFPGISTVQTRARYFLLVPWVYQRLDLEGVRSSDGAAQAREWEVALIGALLAGSTDPSGIIGRESRDGTKQLPSQIYWGGLGRWEVRLFSGTRREYVAGIDRRRARRRRADDEGGGQGELWHVLPPMPEDVFDECTLALEPGEAEYLRARVLASIPDSFLADLMRAPSDGDLGDWPWDADGASAANGEVLHHARLFSLVSWGANLLYNRVLEDRYLADGTGDFGGAPDSLLADWVEAMQAEAAELAPWGEDLDRLWSIVARVNPRVLRLRPFVDSWLVRAIADPGSIARDAAVMADLVAREASIKGHRARLSSKRARETSSGMQGQVRMAFRWQQVSDIVTDIREGLV